MRYTALAQQSAWGHPPVRTAIAALAHLVLIPDLAAVVEQQLRQVGEVTTHSIFERGPLQHRQEGYAAVGLSEWNASWFESDPQVEETLAAKCSRSASRR